MNNNDYLLNLLPDRPIAFNRDFVRLGTGINGALMLSQAISINGDSWFHKTANEWEEETGLTRREQETAWLFRREVTGHTCKALLQSASRKYHQSLRRNK